MLVILCIVLYIAMGWYFAAITLFPFSNWASRGGAKLPIQISIKFFVLYTFLWLFIGIGALVSWLTDDKFVSKRVRESIKHIFRKEGNYD